MSATRRARKWPPAYAARWLDYRDAPEMAELGAHALGARRNLKIHLGHGGRYACRRDYSTIWLAPDRDPAGTDWTCVRGTEPLLIAHDAELDQVQAAAHHCLAEGCALVVAIYRPESMAPMRAVVYRP